MLFSKNFVFFVVIIMGSFFHYIFFCETDNTYKRMTVGQTEAPHLNSVCRVEAADQDQDLTCSKHVGFVMLGLCQPGQEDILWGASGSAGNGAGTCARWLWEGLGIRDYVPSTAPVQRGDPWPSVWVEKPLNGSSPGLAGDISCLPAWAAETLCRRKAFHFALCPNSSPTKSVSITHAGGFRPLSLGVPLHIITDQCGLNTS